MILFNRLINHQQYLNRFSYINRSIRPPLSSSLYIENSRDALNSALKAHDEYINPLVKLNKLNNNSHYTSNLYNIIRNDKPFSKQNILISYLLSVICLGLYMYNYNYNVDNIELEVNKIFYYNS
jgi:hypothetical protein